MTKKEFIERFELVKGEKNYFRNGRTTIERVVYHNRYGNTYIFLDGDLYSVNEENHSIGAGYSWCH